MKRFIFALSFGLLAGSNSHAAITPSGSFLSDTRICTLGSGQAVCSVTVRFEKSDTDLACVWSTRPTSKNKVWCTAQPTFTGTWSSTSYVGHTLELRAHETTTEPSNNNAGYETGLPLDTIFVQATGPDTNRVKTLDPGDDIQAALDTVSSYGGGIVWLNTGEYVLPDPPNEKEFLQIPSNVSLRGTGTKPANTRLTMDECPGTGLCNNRALIRIKDAGNVYLENFKFKGEADLFPESTRLNNIRGGMVIKNCTGPVTLRDIEMRKISRAGMVGKSCTAGTVSFIGIDVRKIGYANFLSGGQIVQDQAFVMGGTDGSGNETPMEGVLLRDSNFLHSDPNEERGRDGTVSFVNSNTITVSETSSVGATSGAIYFVNTHDAVIRGNTLNDTTEFGIDIVDGSSALRFEDNTVSGNEAAGGTIARGPASTPQRCPTDIVMDNNDFSGGNGTAGSVFRCDNDNNNPSLKVDGMLIIPGMVETTSQSAAASTQYGFYVTDQWCDWDPAYNPNPTCP